MIEDELKQKRVYLNIKEVVSNIKVSKNLTVKTGNSASSAQKISYPETGDFSLAFCMKLYITIKEAQPQVKFLTWDDTKKQLVEAYIGAGDAPLSENYTVITEGSTEGVVWGTTGTDTWYVVQGGTEESPITFSNGIKVIGNVHLVLTDGCYIKSASSNKTPGILISESSLTIYGQTAGTGSLAANGGMAKAGIASSSDSKGFTVNGGNITATGGDNASGIGGNYGQPGNNIIILSQSAGL